jgi:type I phosphodiesterase/nucleotide pyrophosphatase
LKAKENHLKQQWLAIALSLSLLGAALPAHVRANDELGKIKHVLLISVDGLHALDVANYIKANPGSALARLAGHGITYSNARTPANSDSFPGLLALVTGGSPVSHGLFYDVSYDRSIFDPTNPTCSGQPGINMIFDESIDQYVTGTDGLPVSLNKINPAALPNFFDKNGNCVRMFPHDAMKSNTIFEVVKSEGGRTAWADKHPAYDLVNGPSGRGVDDLFTPEVTNVGGLDNTVSVVCTAQNDALKVQAIINEIHGFNHDRTSKPGVPAVFGMNFQAVSVGQKLLENNKIPTGGVLCPIDANPPP